MKGIIKKFLRYVIGIIILIILISKVDLDLLKVIISSIQPLYLLPLVFFRFLEIVFASTNLKILFSAVRKIGFMDMLRYQIVNFVGSTILPLSASAIPVMYLLKKKHDINYGIFTSTFVLDKAITFFLTLTVMFFAFVKFYDIRTAGFVFLAGAAALLVLYMLFYLRATRKIVIRLVPERYLKHLSGITSHFRTMIRSHWRLILLNMLSTVAALIAGGLMLMFAFKTLGTDVSLINTVLVSSIARLAVVFAITPSGIGIRQAIGVYLFTLVGVPLTISLAMYLLVLIVKHLLAISFSFTAKLS
ncbi:flippase-like domain-containing protein [Candidatus Woesearchaeota archaeon]|nr:flippase-like domain-containing protein [Candidatus Woesearchaeota archaeon]